MMGARRTVCKLAGAAAVAALAFAAIAVLIITLIYAFTPHRCFLDVLNAQIVKQCQPGTANEFRPFYARSDGEWGLPTPGEVVPGLEKLDQNYGVIRAEMEAAIFGTNGVGENAQERADALPPMHKLYNNIFLHKGSGATGATTSIGRFFEPTVRAGQKLWSRLIYGEDADIFDRIGSSDWRTFNLLLFHHPVPGNAEKCPRTLELLQSIPGIQSALFSVIKPGTYIPPHSDPAKGVIRYHLALRVPRPVRPPGCNSGRCEERRCYIEVDCDYGRGCNLPDHTGSGGHRYRWKEGESVLFDDVFPHWVQNDTDEVRVILFVDILRPLSGGAAALQRISDIANFWHPGVRRLIRESRV